MTTSTAPTVADLEPSDALAWAVGYDDGYAAGWREAAAAAEAEYVDALAQALGGPDCHNRREAVRRHQAAVDARFRREAADQTRPRMGDWPGTENLTSVQRPAAWTSMIGSWDASLTCWCAPVPGKAVCACGAPQATAARVPLDKCPHGCACDRCGQPLRICRTRCPAERQTVATIDSGLRAGAARPRERVNA